MIGEGERRGGSSQVEDKRMTFLLGERLIVGLYRLIQATRIHHDNNQVVVEALGRCTAALDALLGGGEVPVQVWRDRLYVCGERLPFRKDVAGVMTDLVEFMNARSLGGIVFSRVAGEDLAGCLLAFVRLLNTAHGHQDPVGWLEDALREKGISCIEVREIQDEEAGTPERNVRKRAVDMYFNALKVVKGVASKMDRGVAGVRKARRVAQEVVDLINEDPSIMLALATIRDYDDYTYMHSVNVAILAVSLGRYVGLSRVSLEHLAVCGLFHDLGKIEIPKGILKKQGALDKDELDTMRAHPLLGVKKIIRLNAPRVLRSRIILGPFEHHLNPDMTGYPRTHFMKGVSVMGKILKIVDVYDALTSERVYRKRAFTPEEALRKMWAQAGKSFDPILLKCFVSMMGIYPVGSVVELRGGALGIVSMYSPGALRDRPVVMVLEHDGSGGYVCAGEIDLAKEPLEDGDAGQAIARGIPAPMLGINPSAFLLPGLSPA